LIRSVQSYAQNVCTRVPLVEKKKLLKESFATLARYLKHRSRKHRSMNLHLKDFNQRRVGHVHWIPSIEPPFVLSRLCPFILEFIPIRNLTCFLCLSLSTVLAYLLSARSSLRRENAVGVLFSESVWTYFIAYELTAKRAMNFIGFSCFCKYMLLSGNSFVISSKWHIDYVI